MKLSRLELAHIIDHTLIRPTATKTEVTKLCKEAKKYRFGCVIVNPCYVSLAHNKLKTTNIKVASTVGFPIGATLPQIKAEETRTVAELGAQEIDMVMNIGALKSKDYETVKKDIKAVVNIKHSTTNLKTVKVIIETGYLTDNEKTIACKLAKQAGADFVKTSTGLFGGGATVKDIKLMRQTVGKEMGVKAAGGIRTLNDTLAMIEAGANRIGTSNAVNIIEEIPKE